MKPKKLLTILSIGALTIAAAFGAIAYSSARAASPAAAASSSVGIPSERGHGPGREYLNEALAAALGITVDELTSARQTAQAAVLAQAVEKGLITQAQADKLTANGELRIRGLLKLSDFEANGIDYAAELAKALGITVEELQAAYTQAFEASIDQAVADGKLTQEQADLIKGQKALRSDPTFQASMQSAYEAAVAQAVKDGVITQAQADLILKKFSTAGFDGFRGPRFMPGLGGFEGMRGGHHGGMESDPSVQPTTPATP
jgi:polyhydroxyalkanoate synthesis regulator phasin